MRMPSRTLIGVGRSIGASKDEITKGMLAAGLIGIFIAESATFAAEVAGCQVECGAGSSMAAAESPKCWEEQWKNVLMQLLLRCRM